MLFSMHVISLAVIQASKHYCTNANHLGVNTKVSQALSTYPRRFTVYNRAHPASAVGGSSVMKFAQMVEVAIPALRRYARALTRDRDIADDIVQDTLVRALRSEHLFQGADVRAWLYTILANLNRNRLRSLARRPPLSPIQENDAADFSGPELGSRDIVRAFAALTEDQRSTLLLVVLEGLTYREVAEVQAVPLGTVMSRLARARAQINAYLDGERPVLRRVK
jgi:RNA polymerase sigma-70 factor, ECF subfamily